MSFASATPSARVVSRLPVFIAAPEVVLPKARWVLDTWCAALGVKLEPVSELERAGDCVLAYASEPVADVPTLPVSDKAIDLLARHAPLPPASFAALQGPPGPLVAAFPVSGDEAGRRDVGGFAAPADIVSSAFVLLACWDEHTSAERDEHNRFPFAASVFATNPRLDMAAPAVDGYLRLVRDLVEKRLAALGRSPLPAPHWSPAGEGFALALTHDVDILRLWSAREWTVAVKRIGLAAKAGDARKTKSALRAMATHLGSDLPRRRDPYWTFPQLIEDEDARGASSTFFVLGGHTHPTDGPDPELYRQRLPALLRLLGQHGREVGLHGNHRDRIDPAALDEDRASVAERAGTRIDGMRYHYLRCLYHDTLPMLDAAGFAYDSSLAFAEQEGFRCGYSQPFHPYDLARERQLDIVELPLALMDTSLQERKYRGLEAEEALIAGRTIVSAIAAAGGAAAILWHHNRFHPYVGMGYGDVYWRLLDEARAQGAALLSAGELVRRWRRRAGEARTWAG